MSSDRLPVLPTDAPPEQPAVALGGRLRRGVGDVAPGDVEPAAAAHEACAGGPGDAHVREAGRLGGGVDVEHHARAQTVLGELQAEMTEILLEAARAGGLPADRIEEMRRQIEERKETERKVNRVADFISGRDFQNENAF